MGGWSASDAEVFARLHARLARPFEVIGTLSALVGAPPAAVTQGVGLAMATSREARTLLDAMPAAVRSLATSLQTHNERCVGELRGPVLWSETMSARASSFGDRDLFVCATPLRAYDVDENRVLVAALQAVHHAGRDATDNAHGPLDDPVLRLARRIGHEAGHWLDHPSLAPITRVRPTPRALKRTRSGKHRRTYQPALDVLERAVDPIGVEDAAAWTTPLVRARHRVLLGLIERLEQDGRRRVPNLRAEHGVLLAGPLQFHAGRRDGRGLAGVLLGSLLIDVPSDPDLTDRAAAEAEVADRSGGRPSFAVLGPDDLDRALLRAVELAGA
jgi:hypothetical protein